MKAKKRKHLKRFLSVSLAIFLVLGGGVLFLLVSSLTLDRHVRVCPSYPMEDLSAVAAKENFTEEDYAFLYRQTGLTKTAVDALQSSYGRNFAERLEEFQRALFFRGEIGHEVIVSGVTYRDIFCDPETEEPFTAPIARLEAGDVLITSCTHTLGYRHGHAGLVLGDAKRILEAPALGQTSMISKDAVWFRECANFMVLRLKREAGESDEAYAARRKQIADDAEECLLDIPYSLTVGIFSKKNQGTTPRSTNCSHLVWQAYKNAGYEIDADGGPICTPRDISMSGCFDLVQVYGFDPIKLW